MKQTVAFRVEHWTKGEGFAMYELTAPLLPRHGDTLELGDGVTAVVEDVTFRFDDNKCMTLIVNTVLYSET